MVTLEQRTFPHNAWTARLLEVATACEPYNTFSFEGEDPEPLFRYTMPDGTVFMEVICTPSSPGPMAVLALMDAAHEIVPESREWP